MAITYTPPLRDIEFAFEAAGVNDARYDAVANIDMLRSEGAETRQTLLETAKDFSSKDLLKLYQDKSHVAFANGNVITPKGYEKTYQDYVDSGLGAIVAQEKDGGMQLPKALDAAVGQMFFAANNTFSMLRVLNKSVYEGISQNAKDNDAHNAEGKLSSAQRDTMLKNLASGQWSGVMALTEPDAGSDLSNIRTKAALENDGSYRISGSKSFITAADNDYTTLDKKGNIIHLVLAKIGNDKELSLIAVPKLLFDDNGNATAKNTVNIVGIEDKMGMKHSATCTVEYANAKGWLVGERAKGMAAMFDVMNEARRQVGRQSMAIADIAYQNALAYANERRQGRAVHGAEHPSEQADPILVHPGVREMLLRQRAFIEGARVFDFLTELEGDVPQDKSAKAWVELVTNMIKFHFSEQGYQSVDLATRVYGGSGYIRETGIEEYLRDAWVARTYEGTNQIQAVAQVGRHLDKFQVFEKRVNAFIEKHPENKKFNAPLAEGMDALSASVKTVADLRAKDKNAAFAAGEELMHLFGAVALGYAWARSAALAEEKLKHSPDKAEKAFLEEKLETANFYMQRILLPQLHGRHKAITPDILDTLHMGTIRRQQVSPAAQYALIDVTGINLDKRGVTPIEVAKERVALVNKTTDTLSTAEAADAERAFIQLQLDLSDARKGDPVAEAVRAEINRLQQLRQVLPQSALDNEISAVQLRA
jgi:acyl-CoA dehydrogenase